MALALALPLLGCPADPPSSGPATSSGSEPVPAVGPEALPGPLDFAREELGLALELPAQTEAKLVEAGVNRILQVRGDGELVCAINSGPVYPWLSPEDLRQQLGLPEWRSGPIELTSGAPLTGLQAEAWAERPAGEGLQLWFVAGGRIVSVLAERRGELLTQVLATLRSVPGAGIRARYARRLRLSSEHTQAAPGAELRTRLQAGLDELGEDLPQVLTPVVEKGLASHEAGQLDALDALILADLLEPLLTRVRRERRSAPLDPENPYH